MANVAATLEERLEPAQVAVLKSMAEGAADSGVELYLVGGTVRDMLIGRSPADLDVTAVGGHAGLPDVLARRLGGEVVARSQFGTAKLRMDGIDVDLAAARRETYAHPGALPEVSPAGIDQDLARRDFSINAAAVSLSGESWGDLLDPHDSLGDLKRGVIRVLHEGSFVDDATRILRAVHYAGGMRFGLESGTDTLLKRDLTRLDGIGGDRIRHELERILDEEGVVDILELAQRLGVLAAVHPALSLDAGVMRQNLARPRGRPPPGRLPLLAALVAAADPGALAGVAERLSMDSGWARVVRDVGAVNAAVPLLTRSDARPSQVHPALRRLDPAAVEGRALATANDQTRGALEHYLAELRQVRPILRGADIMALGVPEGPRVGELLEELLRARLDGELTTREDEERLVRASLEG